MTLFRTEIHRDIWIDHHCHRCFQPDEASRRLHGTDTMCPILERALRTDRKPVEWERNPRASLMQDSIKCHAFLSSPSKVKADKQFVDVPMFDVEEQERVIVPVDGWPDPMPKKDVDHA